MEAFAGVLVVWLRSKGIDAEIFPGNKVYVVQCCSSHCIITIWDNQNLVIEVSNVKRDVDPTCRHWHSISDPSFDPDTYFPKMFASMAEKFEVYANKTIKASTDLIKTQH